MRSHPSSTQQHLMLLSVPLTQRSRARRDPSRRCHLPSANQWPSRDDCGGGSTPLRATATVGARPASRNSLRKCAMRNPYFDDSPELQACRQKFRLLELERSSFGTAKRFSRRGAPYFILTAGAAGCSARTASATAVGRSIWDPRSDGYTCTCTTRRCYWPSTRRS